MGLTNRSTGARVNESLDIHRQPSDRVVALAGNPNVGKSTVFNALTGMKQHTGNWPGKTVASACGRYEYNGKEYIVVDIPGTYSLSANSAEEEVARDFICFSGADVCVAVADATCLERNLSLILRIREFTSKMVVCLNLMDEAAKKSIHVHVDKLSALLDVPVIPASARSGEGIEALRLAVASVCQEERQRPYSVEYDPETEAAVEVLQAALKERCPDINARWTALRMLDSDEELIRRLGSHYGFDPVHDEGLAMIYGHMDKQGAADRICDGIVKQGEKICRECVSRRTPADKSVSRADRILTSPATGIPIMLLMLGLIMWITIAGANYPSQWLYEILFKFEGVLAGWFEALSAPAWLTGAAVYGVYRTVAWVVSVMLPPMAIFFPIFTLLEDVGYLPRIAFNLDGCFRRAGAHGKQALTTCMGFGCNACGIIGCRIIDSPRERLIAAVTNSFIPCNGRFPALIAVISMFFAACFAGVGGSVVSAAMLTGLILLSICVSLAVSKLLSVTLLKGKPSSFALELPPYRAPKIWSVIVRSVLDRTIFVLGRAVAAAAPAGLLIWVLSNVSVSGQSLLAYCTAALDPIGFFFGVDGVILMAFILGFPANEIVIPIMIMSYGSMGMLTDMSDLGALKQLLVSNGWTVCTALCVLVLILFHFPCATSCQTLYKETKSFKWTAAAFLLPLLTGLSLCALIHLCFFIFA